MPQIIVKGVKSREMPKMAVECSAKLADICQCPQDWFVFDHINSDFYDMNGKTEHWPVGQVWWFERPQEMQDEVAKCLNNYVKAIGYRGSQISFHIFGYSSYYEDGEHY